MPWSWLRLQLIIINYDLISSIFYLSSFSSFIIIFWADLNIQRCKIYISQSIYIIRFSTFFNLFLHTVTFISITFFLLFYFIFFYMENLTPQIIHHFYIISQSIYIIRFSTFFNLFLHTVTFISITFFLLFYFIFFYMENLTPQIIHHFYIISLRE